MLTDSFVAHVIAPELWKKDQFTVLTRSEKQFDDLIRGGSCPGDDNFPRIFVGDMIEFIGFRDFIYHGLDSAVLTWGIVHSVIVRNSRLTDLITQDKQHKHIIFVNSVTGKKSIKRLGNMLIKTHVPQSRS